MTFLHMIHPTSRYISTWFAFDVCSTAPFQSLSLMFTDHGSELGLRLLNMLRLWRLRRVSSLFARFIIRFKPMPFLFVKILKLLQWENYNIYLQVCFLSDLRKTSGSTTSGLGASSSFL